MQIRISFCVLHSQSRLVSEFWCNFWDAILIKFWMPFLDLNLPWNPHYKLDFKKRKIWSKICIKNRPRNGVISDQNLLPNFTPRRVKRSPAYLAPACAVRHRLCCCCCSLLEVFHFISLTEIHLISHYIPSTFQLEFQLLDTRFQIIPTHFCSLKFTSYETSSFRQFPIFRPQKSEWDWNFSE